MVNTELSSKRIELLKEIAPGITRIAVFTDPTMGPQGLPETAAAARALGLELQVLDLTGAARSSTASPRPSAVRRRRC
jgi:ABC-type uncharacterized transport system substrate-binding protein